jgi:hypothetical protein
VFCLSWLGWRVALPRKTGTFCAETFPLVTLAVLPPVLLALTHPKNKEPAARPPALPAQLPFLIEESRLHNLARKTAVGQRGEIDHGEIGQLGRLPRIAQVIGFAKT